MASASHNHSLEAIFSDFPEHLWLQLAIIMAWEPFSLIFPSIYGFSCLELFAY